MRSSPIELVAGLMQTMHFSFKKGFAAFVLLVLLVLFVGVIRSMGKVLPNVSVGSTKIGGMKSQKVRDVILDRVNAFENNALEFEIEGKVLRATPGALGLDIDAEATYETAFSIGRSGTFIADILNQVRSSFLPHQIYYTYRLDFEKLTNFLNTELSRYEIPARNATIAYNGTFPYIVGDEAGLVVDRSQLIADIALSAQNLDSSVITVNKVEQTPLVNKAGAQKALEKVKALSQERMRLVYGYDSWNLGGTDLVSILKFYPQGYSGDYLISLNFPSTIGIKSIGDSNPLLDVSVDEAGLSGLLDEIAKVVDRPKVNATLKFEDGRVIEFSPARDGQELDRNLSRQMILAKLSVDNINIERDVVIKLPVSITIAQVANEEINSLGIKELIGRGVSYYAGSIPNRAYNVQLGSNRITGKLIAPGETFSFNETVGEVSGKTGYKQAYVISAGRTVLDDGGGICQVSTTVFRAALAAGLPIVSRTAHAYRVGYYEQRGFMPGLDATVYSPSVDFKFKNDTKFHILLQTVVDPTNAMLEVDLYGTSDSRKVEMSTPVITSQTPALPDRNEDAPTLPKGTIKQVDFSAAGATSVFTRKVLRGDRVLQDDVFKSNYRPWAAVYLVGTKE